MVCPAVAPSRVAASAFRIARSQAARSGTCGIQAPIRASKALRSCCHRRFRRRLPVAQSAWAVVMVLAQWTLCNHPLDQEALRLEAPRRGLNAFGRSRPLRAMVAGPAPPGLPFVV